MSAEPSFEDVLDSVRLAMTSAGLGHHADDVLATVEDAIVNHIEEEEPRILTITEVSQLAVLHQMARTNARVAWIDPEKKQYETQFGTARSIGDENGNFLNERDDVRDAFFRITTSMGWELFLPVSKACEMVGNGYLVEDRP